MSNSLDPISIHLFDRYLANQCTPDEAAAIQEWIDRNSEHTAIAAAFRALRIDNHDSGDVERVLHRVHRESGMDVSVSTDGAKISPLAHRITTSTPAMHTRMGISRTIVPRIAFYTISASLLAIAVIAGWFGGVHRLMTEMSTHVSTYTTGNGERATITLPDGSTVLLNVASRLQVLGDYSAGHRTLELSGEALFTVVAHNNAPFIVKAGSSTTRVLGTSFVVRHYATDTAAIVSVREGKVSVASTVVSARQQAIVTPTQAPRVQRVEEGRFTFADGVLTLDDMTLCDAIPELNRWYNVDIQLGDPALAQRGIGGSFAAGSIWELEKLLELAYNLRIVRSGRVITLFSK